MRSIWDAMFSKIRKQVPPVLYGFLRCQFVTGFKVGRLPRFLETIPISLSNKMPFLMLIKNLEDGRVQITFQVGEIEVSTAEEALRLIQFVGDDALTPVDDIEEIVKTTFIKRFLNKFRRSAKNKISAG